MYDQPFTSNWFNDICLTGSVLFNNPIFFTVFSVVIGLFISFLLINIQAKKITKNKPLLLSIAGLIVILSFISATFYFGNLLPTTYFPFVLVVSLLFLFFIYFGLWKSYLHRNNLLYKLLYIFIVGPVFAIIFALIYFIFSLFICDNNFFTSTFSDAHRLHGVMKTWHDNGKAWPKDLHDLRAMDEESFDLLTKEAKIYYSSDQTQDWYTLIVRPSRYFIMTFDPFIDYGFYTLYQWQSVWGNLRPYPPDYPGPWEQLPK